MNWLDEIDFVFLPGLDGTGLTYRPLGEAMPENARVRVVNYPKDRKFSFKELVRCAYEQLPPNKQLVLIAESFSGPISISMAGTFPTNIKGIVFCATFMKLNRPLLLGAAKYLPLSLFFRKPIPDFLLSFLCGDKPFSDKLIPLFRQLEKLVQPEVIAHRIRMLNDIDVTEAARKLNLPCCYIQGIQDKMVPARSVIPFKEYLPDVIVKRVDGPHGILQAKPVECVEIIMEFVRNILTSKQQ